MEQIEMKDTEQLKMLHKEKALLLAKLEDQEKILKKRSYTLLYIIFALTLSILLFIVTNINMLTGEGDDYVTIKTTTTDSTSVKKISIGEYIDDLSRENDSLQLALLQLKSENLRMRMDSLKLAIIQKNYPIEIKEDGNTMWAESPKIDSALLLLPYYRDKIKKLSDGSWEIVLFKTEK